MKKNKIEIKTKKRGSVLVFTLFLLAISLFLGMSLIASSITGRRSSIATGKSVHSFQVADSGLEYAFFKIREYKDSTGLMIRDAEISDIFTAGCDSAEGYVEYDTGMGIVNLYFYYDDSGTKKQADCDSNITFSDIEYIKSVGIHNDISRSVEAEDLNFKGI